jgi:hypothetical protein
MSGEQDGKLEELWFAKKQQWSIAAAAMTLLGAIYGAAHTMTPLVPCEKVIGTILALLIAIAGSIHLVSLQNHLAATRDDEDKKEAWRRGASVLYTLVAVLVIGALVVVYYIWRPVPS